MNSSRVLNNFLAISTSLLFRLSGSWAFPLSGCEPSVQCGEDLQALIGLFLLGLQRPPDLKDLPWPVCYYQLRLHHLLKVLPDSTTFILLRSCSFVSGYTYRLNPHPLASRLVASLTRFRQPSGLETREISKKIPQRHWL